MAHRTQPPSRDEIAEQTIDFIEGLGFPLVPWQAEMLRAMLKHDGPVEVYPRPREHPRPSHCSATELTNTQHTHRCLAHVTGPYGMALHLCQCAYSWIAEIKHLPEPGQVRVQRDGELVWEAPPVDVQEQWEKQCLCTMGYAKHCPVHGGN